MGNYIKHSAAILFLTFFMLLGLSFLNYLTIKNVNFSFINKIDFLNNRILSPSIIDLKSHYVQREKRKKKVEFIVYHHSGVENSKGVNQVNEFHLSKGWRGIAYNYYINKEGIIYNLLDTSATNASEKGFNEVSISICLDGDFDKEKIKHKQYIPFLKLANHLKNKYPDADLLPHSMLNNTGCAGKNISDFQIQDDLAEFHFMHFLKKKHNEK